MIAPRSTLVQVGDHRRASALSVRGVHQV